MPDGLGFLSRSFARRVLRPALALCIVLAAGCTDPGGEQPARAPPAPVATTHEADRPDHDAHAGGNAHAAPELPATPWPSDPPLREGMRRMHRAVQALTHAEHDHLDAAQATAAAQHVQDAASYMIANCKLAPEPDAALHGVLSTLLAGAAAIKADPTDTTPVAAMREALALYPRMFEDPEWQADTALAP